MILMLILLFVPHTRAFCKTHDAETIDGHDIGDPIDTNSKATCCELCQEDASCLAAVFDGLQCHKKSAVGPITVSFLSVLLVADQGTPAPPTPAPVTPAPPKCGPNYAGRRTKKNAKI